MRGWRLNRPRIDLSMRFHRLGPFDLRAGLEWYRWGILVTVSRYSRTLTLHLGPVGVQIKYPRRPATVTYAGGCAPWSERPDVKP